VRLSISNSNNKSVIGIILLITVVILLLIEYFYIQNKIPVYVGKDHDLLVSQSKLSTKPILFILGDSRAEAGIIPELIDSATYYDAYNIGIDGVYKGYYNKLIANNVIPEKIVIAVSPYSIFKKFQLKKNDLLSKSKIIRKPNEYSEKYLSRLINHKTHLHYGFMGFFDVLNYKKTSESYSKKGFHGYDRLGSDEYYTSMVNLEGYRNKIIEAYKDSLKINEGKINFENLVVDLKKNKISVLFIRIPVSDEIKKIENEKYPWFSDYIQRIVSEGNYLYVEFNDFDYPKKEVDGSHLSRISARTFTKDLLRHID
jgi:hypothetical protein